MIDSTQYFATVKKIFFFLHSEFNISEIKEKKNGNAYYDIKYIDQTKVISISYENIGDYLQIIVFKLENGQMPNYDDKSKTLHLNHLNRLALVNAKADDFKSNNDFFKEFSAATALERQLLKAGKDLRLSLKLLPSL